MQYNSVSASIIFSESICIIMPCSSQKVEFPSQVFSTLYSRMWILFCWERTPPISNFSQSVYEYRNKIVSETIGGKEKMHTCSARGVRKNDKPRARLRDQWQRSSTRCCRYIHKKVYSFSSSPLEIKQVVKFDIKRIAYICRSRERINRDRDTIETCYTRELARELRHVCV
jgi:hypothetical protein